MSNGIIWPKELNQKSCSFFSAQHTIQGETEGSPFQFFGIVRLFFEKVLMTSKGPPFNFMMFCDRNIEKTGRVPPFSAPIPSNFCFFLRFCKKRILDTLKSFCYFRALDIALTQNAFSNAHFSNAFPLHSRSIMYKSALVRVIVVSISLFLLEIGLFIEKCSIMLFLFLLIDYVLMCHSWNQTDHKLNHVIPV